MKKIMMIVFVLLGLTQVSFSKCFDVEEPTPELVMSKINSRSCTNTELIYAMNLMKEKLRVYNQNIKAINEDGATAARSPEEVESLAMLSAFRADIKATLARLEIIAVIKRFE